MGRLIFALLLVFALMGSWTAAQGTDTGLEFDGVDDLVSFGDVDDFDFGVAPFTIEFWMKKPNTRREAILTKRSICDHSSFWSVRYMATDGNLGLEINGEQCVSGPTIVAHGNWHHVAFTRDGDTIRTYLNGHLFATDQHSTFAGSIGNGASMRFGDGPCVGGDGTRAFSGSLDEVMIWNLVRTESEIAEDSTGVRTGGESGLMAYWRMDEGTGQQVGDVLGTHPGQMGSTQSPDPNDPLWVDSGVPYPVELTSFSVE